MGFPTPEVPAHQRCLAVGASGSCSNRATTSVTFSDGVHRCCRVHERHVKAGKAVKFFCEACCRQPCVCAKNRFWKKIETEGAIPDARTARELKRKAEEVGEFLGIRMMCDSCNAPGPFHHLRDQQAYVGWFIGLPVGALEPLRGATAVTAMDAAFFRFAEGAHFLALCPKCLAVYDDMLLEKGLSKLSLRMREVEP